MILDLLSGQAHRRATRASLWSLFPLAVAALVHPACQSGFETCDGGDCEDDGQEMSVGGQGGETTVEQGGAGGAPLECNADELLCDDTCVDPAVSVTHCGAQKNCAGDNAGSECKSDERCEEGACILDCPEGYLDCVGECIDPMSSELYCGAQGACDTSARQGDHCQMDELCAGGGCRSWGIAEDLVDAYLALTPVAAVGSGGNAVVGTSGFGDNFWYASLDEAGWTQRAPPGGSATGTEGAVGLDASGNVHGVWPHGCLRREAHLRELLGRRFDELDIFGCH